MEVIQEKMKLLTLKKNPLLRSCVKQLFFVHLMFSYVINDEGVLFVDLNTLKKLICIKNPNQCFMNL